MRMRCPNSACRLVFIVQDIDQVNSKTGRYTELVPEAVPVEEPKQPDQGGSKQGKPHSPGSVGEFVTILEAEVVKETPPAPANPPPSKSNVPRKDAAPTLPAEVVDEQGPAASNEGASWREPPPVRKPPAGKVERQSTTSSPPEPAGGASSWEIPPPVRRQGADGAAESPAPDDGGQVNVFEADTLPAAVTNELTPARSSRAARRTLAILLILLLGIGVTASILVVFALNSLTRRESTLFDTAKRDYGDAKYASAAADFENLVKDFPKSEQLPRYRLYAELSQIRDQVAALESDSVAALEKLNQFVKAYKDSRLFK